MRIVLQLLYTQSWSELAKEVVPNVVNYCRKHGYVWNIQLLNEPYDAFEKISQIKSIFDNDKADIIMSLDCDLKITNYNIKVEDFIQNGSDLLLTKDVNGINCGVFIFRKSVWTNEMLEYILNMKGKGGIHCEQDAIAYYQKRYPHDRKIGILYHPSINSYLYENYPEFGWKELHEGQWQTGCFILHLPGIGMEKRLDILKTTPVIL